MKILLGLVVVFFAGFLAFRHFFKPKTATVVREIAHGPFTVRLERFSSWSFNMNVGRQVEHISIRYSVWYRGQPVAFSEQLQTNTGFRHLWRVYILQDAPSPTLLAGSQSLYLIYEKDGAAVVSPVEEQGTDFANLQWLDARDGQPAPSNDVFMADENTPMDRLDTLAGGEYLLVNRHYVLHVPTLEKFACNPNNEAIDNYSYSRDALAFSPDRRTIVFPAEYQTWNSPEKTPFRKGLFAFDFTEGKGYVVPFGKTETRLYDDQEITPAWFETYFEWQKTDGADLLIKKRLPNPPLWTGRFGDIGYNLFPVKPDMQALLLQFTFDHLHWTREQIREESYHEYTGRRIRIGRDGIFLEVVQKGDVVSLSRDLYDGDETRNLEKVREIGAAFNALLEQGRYQDYFTEIREYEPWEE